MEYFSINALNGSIRRIIEGDVTQEHRTGTAALGLVRNYFSVHKYAVTPEQIQNYPKKRPDLSIELFEENLSRFVPHCFIEVKSLVNSNLDKIVVQLFETLRITIDDSAWITGNYSIFMIGIKGTNIAFYVYHSFGSLLDDYDIMHYKGFIPLNYVIPMEKMLELNHAARFAEMKYELYVKGLNFATDSRILEEIGALKTKNIDHPHVLDLLNEKHRDHIHNMFNYVAYQTPGPWVKDE